MGVGVGVEFSILRFISHGNEFILMAMDLFL
jgi:hypothetical protein